jgi:hypothetical protein
VATGAPLSLTRSRHGCAGVRFLYPPEDCRVVEVTVPEPVEVPGLHEVRAFAAAGAELRLPPNAHQSRHACVLAVAADRAACERALDQAAGLVRLRYEPLAEPYHGRPW